MVRLHRIVGRAVALCSLGAVATAVVLARSSAWWIAAIVILAMTWGAAPQAIDAVLGDLTPPEPASSAHGSFTIAIHVGRQPVEVSRVGIAAAMAVAPTVVVATDPAVLDLLGPLACPVFVGETIECALNDAAATVDTDAFLVLSASSFVDVGAAEIAAGLIREGAGWIIGRSRTFNDDGFSPLVRARLGNCLRRSARRGGVPLWEANATVVSTALVRQEQFTRGRPWGAMLRALHADGARGAEYDMTLSMTSQPVDATSYWPASVLRQRRVVADLADAAATSNGRSRWLAIGLLLRELDGCLLTVWLLSPWLVTRAQGSAFRCPTWAVVALAGVPALLRWVGSRFAHRVSVHPLQDMLALAFDAPGSVLAVPTAFTRRVGSTHVRLPGQPLALAGVVFAAITAIPLFTKGTTAERSAAVGLALTELALLWMLTMRAIFQRNWARTTYRVRAPLSARIDGRQASTLDLSPTGLAVEGSFDDVPVGEDVAVDIALDDASTLRARGTIVARRRRAGKAVAGVSLRIEPVDESRWVAQLSRSVAASSSHSVHWLTDVHTAAVGGRRGSTKWLRRAIVATITMVSLTAVAALCVALVGYRPLIVRSGSMEPALGVGDVVLVEDVKADQLVVGDITTIRDPSVVSDSLTHRVRAVTIADGVLTLITRGDANTVSETFTVAPTAVVGRVVTRVPFVGTVVAWAGSDSVRWLAAGMGAIAAAAVLQRGHRRKSRSVAFDG